MWVIYEKEQEQITEKMKENKGNERINEKGITKTK